MNKLAYIFLGTFLFTKIFCPNIGAATHDDTYDHLAGPDHIRVSYEFKNSHLGEDINISVHPDGNAPVPLLTIPRTLEIKAGEIYRVNGYSRNAARQYLEFSATIGGNTSSVFPYNMEVQEPIFENPARILLELKGKPLESKASPLESFRFIIGKTYPDNPDSPLYVSVVCKHGTKGESQKPVSSPSAVRRKASIAQPNSDA